MHRGWLKVWRKIEDNSSWSRGIEYRGLMLTVLQKANWKTGLFQGREIMPGQFATSGDSLANDLKINRLKCVRMLKKLSQDGLIRVENVNNRFTLITVVNWDTYQGDDKTNEQPMNNQRTTDEQPVNTIKESKKERTKIDSDIIDFVTKFQQATSSYHGAAAPDVTDELIKKSSDVVDKLIRLDKFKKEDVFQAVLWATKDNFWKNQIKSLAQLRNKKKGADTTKFQNMYSSYLRDNPVMETHVNIEPEWEEFNKGFDTGEYDPVENPFDNPPKILTATEYDNDM